MACYGEIPQLWSSPTATTWTISSLLLSPDARTCCASLRYSWKAGADLREKLSVSSGGVVFTTIQKVLSRGARHTYPTLSERRNIVVIADEAHRSQYDFIDGFARHMRDALPNASFVGFTGTPIELQDSNTRAVFGDYISIYDIQRSVEDGATRPPSTTKAVWPS